MGYQCYTGNGDAIITAALDVRTDDAAEFKLIAQDFAAKALTARTTSNGTSNTNVGDVDGDAGDEDEGETPSLYEALAAECSTNPDIECMTLLFLFVCRRIRI